MRYQSVETRKEKEDQEGNQNLAEFGWRSKYR